MVLEETEVEEQKVSKALIMTSLNTQRRKCDFRCVPRIPQMGAVCYRVSQHWGGLPSSLRGWRADNESMTVTLSLMPGAQQPTILWWITQFTKTIIKLNPVKSFFMWNANLFTCLWQTLSSDLPEQYGFTLHNYSNNTWYSLYNIF